MAADDTVIAKLAEWEALAEEATPGPWWFEAAGESECGEPQCCSECWDNRIWGDGAVLTESMWLSEADAEFIAAARTAMPALLGFVREVQHILANQRHEVIGARGVREQDVVRARDIEQAARKWIGGEG